MREIKILNTMQVQAYLKDGVHPLRLELGKDDKVVYIYNADDTKEVWLKWKQCSYK